jgi:glycosyltransferase involved in cell wall biosynthesis
MINESGIGRYIENLITNLNHIDNKTSYFLFVLNKENFKLKLNSNFELVPANFSWHGFSEQINFLKLLNTYKLDLYHSPHPNMPYFYFRDFIITVHDLTMLKFKTGRASTYTYPLYFLKWVVFKLMLTFAIKRAKKVITVSNFVKNQILEEFKLTQDKVKVIYNGVSDSITKEISQETQNIVIKKFNLTKPFLFYVGNAYPHKNLERLIMAFELFNRDEKYQLFLGGKVDFFYQRLMKDYANLKNVNFGGYLTDAEISTLYLNCEAFVYPSISEGFGIQIIEALKVGAKVTCSNNSSFPEIAGKHAFYFNPFEIQDIKKTFEVILSLPKNHPTEELKIHLEKFNWKDSAQSHYEVYQKN